MLAATSRGARGICEVRDAGLPVPLADEGPTVHEVDLDDAVSRNRPTHANQFEVGARSRGVTHTTFRRVTEALNISGLQRNHLRQLLINGRSEQYDVPLRRIA